MEQSHSRNFDLRPLIGAGIRAAHIDSLEVAITSAQAASGSRSITRRQPRADWPLKGPYAVCSGPCRTKRDGRWMHRFGCSDKMRTVVPVLCQLTQVFMVCSGRNSRYG
jgi:hypothetical protein